MSVVFKLSPPPFLNRERVKWLIPPDRIKWLIPPEDRIKWLIPPDRIKWLIPPDRIKWLIPPADRLSDSFLLEKGNNLFFRVHQFEI